MFAKDHFKISLIVSPLIAYAFGYPLYPEFLAVSIWGVLAGGILIDLDHTAILTYKYGYVKRDSKASITPKEKFTSHTIVLLLTLAVAVYANSKLGYFTFTVLVTHYLSDLYAYFTDYWERNEPGKITRFLTGG